MSWFRSIIYQPNINWLIRNGCRLISAIIPEGSKIHPSGTITVRLNSETRFRLKTNQTSYITRQLFWDGPSKFEYTPIFFELVKSVNSFWDVGANIGYYSVLGAIANPGLKILAFEPSAGPKQYIHANFELNGLAERATVAPIALSNFNGEIEFHEIFNPKFPTTPNLSGEHNIGTKKELPANKLKVKSLRLDDYVKPEDVIDIMKIDTEGAEVEILKGGRDTIERQQPIIIVETLFNRLEGEIEGILGALGYSFYNHTPKGLEHVQTIVRKVDNGVRNCFCVPPSKKHLIEPFLVVKG